jgi:site-specific DNA recombinase
MDVAVYPRVSTTRQQQTHSAEQQWERLQAYLATQPDWHLAPEHLYRDEGYSGATLTRPGLSRLREHAALAAFERVLITAPDRLARSYVHQVLLIDELARQGCTVVFLDRPMSADPHDQLALQIRGAVAEYERALIAERMRRGRQAKLRAGLLLPWSRAPYGYLLDVERPRDPTRVRPDPVTAPVVRQIFAWYTDARAPLTLYGIARDLSAQGIPSPSGQPRWNVASVRGILRSPAYAGTAYSGRTRHAPARHRKSALRPVGPGYSQQPTPAEEWIAIPVPALISSATFDAAQAQLDRNTPMARRHNTAQAYLLRGLLSCGRSQLACTGRSRARGYAYYGCRGRTDLLRAARGERCTARYAPAQALDALVWADLCRVLSDPSLLTHELTRLHQGTWRAEELRARHQDLGAALAQLERQQERVLEAYLAEIIGREEFARKRQEILRLLNGLAHQRRQIEAQMHQQHDESAHHASPVTQHGALIPPSPPRPESPPIPRRSAGSRGGRSATPPAVCRPRPQSAWRHRAARTLLQCGSSLCTGSVRCLAGRPDAAAGRRPPTGRSSFCRRTPARSRPP